MKNLEVRKAEFKRDVEALVQNVNDSMSAEYTAPIDGLSSNPLEHTTRRNFLDHLFEALGWKLGTGGNTREEVRIKANTVQFLDYLGVKKETNTPIVLIEAKRWSEPHIVAAPQLKANFSSKSEIVSAAIDYILSNDAELIAPVSTGWIDILTQVKDYVKDIAANTGHVVQRAVITSGKWLIIFTNPGATFLSDGKNHPDRILVFEIENYVEHSSDILKWLDQKLIAPDIPDILEPQRVGPYVKPQSILKCFSGLHVRYERSGSEKFSIRPQIIVYPVLIIERSDGAYLKIARRDDGLGLTPSNCTPASMTEHHARIQTAVERLIRETSQVVGLELLPEPLAEFSGFPTEHQRGVPIPNKQVLIAEPKVADEFLIATGDAPHFLLETPRIAECEWHSWNACHANGNAYGDNALSSPSIKNPRSYFIDGHPHHCANRALILLREERCKIAQFEERLCCQACSFLTECWSDAEREGMPCGALAN